MAARRFPALALLTGLVVVVGIALALVLVLREPPPVAAPEAVRPVVPTRAADAPAPVLPVVEPDDRPPPPDREVPRPGALAGRIVDETGRGLADARVELLLGAPRLGRIGEVETTGRTTTTDAGGRFTLRDVPVGGELALRLASPDFVPEDVGPYDVQPGETTDVGSLVVDAGITLRGRVYGPRREPVPGARVELHRQSVRSMTSVDLPPAERIVLSGDDGTFAIQHAGRGHFELLVTADGYANGIAERPQAIEADVREWTVDVPLEKSAELVGWILEAATDDGIAGADVVAQPLGMGLGRSVVRTDATGRFRFLDLAAGSYRLWADPVGYARGQTEVPATRYSDEVVLRLELASALTGFIRDPEGEPVRGFDLLVKVASGRHLPGNNLGRVRRVTNDDGFFELTDLEPGWYSFEVWARGYAVTLSEPTRLKRAGRVDGLVITLQPGAVLRGRVVDDTGRGIAAASVSLRTNRQPAIDFLRASDRDAVWLSSTRTRKDGTWELDGVTERAYQVEVDHPAYPTALVNDVDARAGDTTDVPAITLQRPGRLTGLAINSAGQKVPGVTVYLTGKAGSNRTVTTNTEGRFVFERLVPGRYGLLAAPAKPGLADIQALGRATMKAIVDPSPEDYVDIGPGETRELNVRVGG